MSHSLGADHLILILTEHARDPETTVVYAPVCLITAKNLVEFGPKPGVA